MSFDEKWETIHQSMDWSTEPDVYLQAFCFKHFYHASIPRQLTALDLGCATGANSLMLASKGINVIAVDGSKTAIKKLKATTREQSLAHRVVAIQNDILNIDGVLNYYLHGGRYLDCAFDVVSLAYLTLDEASQVIRAVCGKLRPKGRFFARMACEPFDMAMNRTDYYRLVTLADINKLFAGLGTEVRQYQMLVHNKPVSFYTVDAIRN